MVESLLLLLWSRLPVALIEIAADFRGPQSVGFTAAPVFAAATVWFVVFGIVLFVAACCFCCCPGRASSYSRACLAISLLLLLAVTAAAA